MRAKLGEIYTLQMGKTPARKTPEYWNNGDNDWVSIADLSTYQKYVGKTKESISDVAVKESGIKTVPANTVIMSFKLSIGKTAITVKPTYTNEAIMAFIPTGKYQVLPEYAYYLFSGRDWSAGSNKAVMGITLNKATLQNVEITVPSLEVQHSVIEKLDKVSEVIALRELQLATLDELVIARFVEMFGDPEFNTKNLSVVPLNELCEIGSSKRIYQSEQSATGIPFLRISDLVTLMDTGELQANLYIPPNRYKELRLQGFVPNTGDILVTSRGTLGRCYIIKDTDVFYFQDGMISWLYKFSNEIEPVYIKYLFMMKGFRKQIDSLQAGSTVAYLSISMLKKLKIMLPPIELQTQFASFVRSTDQTKSTIQTSLNQLETLKKSLMQDYFG